MDGMNFHTINFFSAVDYFVSQSFLRMLTLQVCEYLKGTSWKEKANANYVFIKSQSTFMEVNWITAARYEWIWEKKQIFFAKINQIIHEM